MKPREIKTKIRGVSYKNPDGSDRQAIIRKHIHGGCELLLAREPDNPHSETGNAVSVWYEKRGVLRRKRLQLGYLGSDLSDEVAPLLDLKWRYRVVVLGITGGSRQQPTRGVNIKIELHPPE